MNNADSDPNDKKEDEDQHDNGTGESNFNNEINKKNKKPNTSKQKAVDPRLKRLLWYLIASTRDGVNIAKIISFLKENPLNANQLSVLLKLDYNTVTHHLNVLNKNSFVNTYDKDSYGATYFISTLMEKNYPAFDEIMDRIGKK